MVLIKIKIIEMAKKMSAFIQRKSTELVEFFLKKKAHYEIRSSQKAS